MSLCQRSFCKFLSPKIGRLAISFSHRTFSQFSKNTQNWKPKHILFRCVRQEVKRKTLAPVEEVEIVVQSSWRDLFKPFGFTVLVGGTSFLGCSIWQYESMRYKLIKAKEFGHSTFHKFYGKAGGLRGQLNENWNHLSPGQQLVTAIIATNVAVFLAWRIVPQRIMLNYFCSSPFNKAPCSSMLFSTFSHHALFHLAANMYVLWSFTPTITNLLGREQFLAMYITSGMVSAYASYIYRVARASPIPSLGASGAIMAVLGAVCSYYPDARLSIAFVDKLVPHSFSAGSAMKCIVLFDALGLVFGWRFFDHAAHLGGMLFGIWYINYGHKIMWNSRQKFLKMWHEFRGKP